jgi:hypothetical protein
MFMSSHPSRRASRLTSPRLNRSAALVLMQLMLLGCAQAQTPVALDDGPPTSAVPLPKGWHQPQPPTARTTRSRDAQPLWGVPSFEAPHATHCARAPQLAQVDGRQPSQATSRHSHRGHAEGKHRLLESRAADAAPAAPSPLAATLADDKAASAEALSRERRPSPQSSAMAAPAKPHQPSVTVNAGMVDDNADFASYVAFVNRQQDASLRTRDVSERYRVDVRDEHGRPVADAELALSWPGAREALVWARSDAGGTAWLHPRGLVAPQTLQGLGRMEVMARSQDGEIARTPLQRGQKSAVALRMAGSSTLTRTDTTPLDLVFMVDATGSMGDEIGKLRSSMKTMADRIAALPGGIDLCLGLVAYRDHGEEYLTRTYDLSHDLTAFQGVLSSLQAQAGGDEPEALNEALAQTVHKVSWRGAGTSRLVVMLADAPPHMDRGAPYYDQSSAAALARGIKVHTVGASGLNPQGEAVFRSIAQTTGGRFVFLTYQDARRPGRGPGTETTHDVRDYSVATLDDLIVRLVSDEINQRKVR